MHEMPTQTEAVPAYGPGMGGEERNKTLHMLVCDLLRANQELRCEVAHLHAGNRATMS
jgi:hypothetical protein